MIKNIYSTLDIKNLEVNQIANVKQYDDVILTLEIRENDKTINVKDNIITLKFTREDKKTFIQTTDITINDNIVTIKLKAGTFNIVGTCLFELEIQSLDGSISTSTFKITVIEAINLEEGQTIPNYETVLDVVSNIRASKFDDGSYQNKTFIFKGNGKVLQRMETDFLNISDIEKLKPILKGDKGDKGDKGEQGLQGLKGDIGATGPQGEVGTTNYNDLLNKPDLTLYVSKEELNKSTSMQVTLTELINKLENASNGFLNINSIKGKTIQHATNLADIKSVGDEGKLNIITNGVNLVNEKEYVKFYVDGKKDFIYSDTNAKSVILKNPKIGEKIYFKNPKGNKNAFAIVNEIKDGASIIERLVSDASSITPTKKGNFLIWWYDLSDNVSTDICLSYQPIINYETYKEDKQEITLTEPLRSLPNEICDEIVNDEIIRRVEKLVLNGSENWKAAQGWEIGTTNTLYISIDSIYDLYNTLCISDKFKGYSSKELEKMPNNEGVCITTGNLLIFRTIQQTPTAFKEWLQANPTTVYYPLATPIKEPLKLKNMASFKDGYLRVDSEITPIIDLNYPIDIGNSIQTIQEKVIELDGVQKSLLSLADKELKMSSINLLATETNTDLKNKINEILSIWR